MKKEKDMAKKEKTPPHIHPEFDVTERREAARARLAARKAERQAQEPAAEPAPEPAPQQAVPTNFGTGYYLDEQVYFLVDSVGNRVIQPPSKYAGQIVR